MKMLCKLLGGSHLYGLNTPSSDLDYRGVFINDGIGEVVGLRKHEEQIQTGEEDICYYELRRFLQLLAKTNTQVMEILNADKFIEVDADFKKYILDEHQRFYNTERFYKSISGYMYGEKRRANGELTGQLGHKRKAAIEQYGFSAKNFCNLLRLSYAGTEFFRTHKYPVNIKEYCPQFHETLMDIKVHPEHWTVDKLNELADHHKEALDKEYNDRDVSKDLHFDDDYANWALLQMYAPIVASLKLTTIKP